MFRSAVEHGTDWYLGLLIALRLSTSKQIIKVMIRSTGHEYYFNIPAIDTLAWSSGGEMLALSGWHPEVLIWNLTEDIPVLTTIKIGMLQGTRHLAWSPDSSKFAIRW